MKKTFWILVAVLVVSITINVWQWKNQPEAETKVEHDTVWKDTTITPPQPTEQKETGEAIYVKVPIPPTPQPKDTTGTVEVPTGQDSATIALPVEQKRYDDSLYTAWVSGFRPRLDSIRLHFPDITHTITNTVYAEPPRLTWGIQIGAGYGIVNRKPDVYIGVGLQYNIWRK